MEAAPSNSALEKDRSSQGHVAVIVPSDHHRSSTLNDSSIDHLDKGRHHPYWFVCCAWSCLLLFFLVIAFLFACITYLAFLKSGMPLVYVRAFNITGFQVDEGSQKMDAVIGLKLLFSNKNDKLQLLYGPLSIDVTSENILLGKNKVDAFTQMPLNDTNLDMIMTVNNADVNPYAAEDLKADIKANEMVFDVYAGGHIGFKVGSLEMNNVPFVACCHEINLMDVDFGRRPSCDVKLFSGRPATI
ncbi:hypothetical protein PHAVU_006G080100 [Phaseolus vulgaris]|uniref:Late embryogenesis abundant protein LEA-2 subgroup domain-containing protein n=1 Tax=Phaseolus vulgaris TaxID=3885 RepID=V7BQP3_PHAVU|nr:hypothetical protein PHAVU_006G080100g [Phaseolus vulgaris]ESW18896.1 hypothetical protein PHAVU_006G080100g [Phaseolus vulgaris]